MIESLQDLPILSNGKRGVPATILTDERLEFDVFNEFGVGLEGLFWEKRVVEEAPAGASCFMGKKMSVCKRTSLRLLSPHRRHA